MIKQISIVRLQLILLLIVLLLSCNSTSSKKINYELIGEYKFIGEFTPTINGKVTSGKNYKIRRSYQQLMNICSDKPYSYDEFLEKCINIQDLTKEDLNRLFKKHDLITSTVKINTILENTEYTRSDGCDYTSDKLVEVHTENSVKRQEGKIYLYKMWPKGKYRFNACP